MQRISLSSLAMLFRLLSAHAQKVDSAKDHFDKAVSYMLDRKYDQALSEANQAIQMDGQFAEAYLRVIQS